MGLGSHAHLTGHGIRDRRCLHDCHRLHGHGLRHCHRLRGHGLRHCNRRGLRDCDRRGLRGYGLRVSLCYDNGGRRGHAGWLPAEAEGTLLCHLRAEVPSL